MASHPLGVGIIGCGMLARSQHLPNVLATPEARLRVCCDLDEAALAECRRLAPEARVTRDFREALAASDVDLAIVATSETFRLPIFQEAVRLKKPVLTEKPLAATWEECLRAHAMFAGAGVPICVGHNRRCSPAMKEARDLFRRHMESPRPCPWRFQRPGWERIPVGAEDGLPALSIRINDDWRSWKAVHLQGIAAKVGLLLGEMTHFTDLACWFLDADADSVSVFGSGILNHSVSIRFRNQAIASILMGGNGTFGYPKELLEVMGNGGVVAVDHMLEVRTAGIEGAPARKIYPMLGDRHPNIGTEGGLSGWLAKKRAACEEAAARGDPMLQFTAEPDKGHKRMLGEFLREIRGEREPISPTAAALRGSRICFAAVTSAMERRVVSLDEIAPAP
ncbi:MAG: Gfo/Idh/MocA family oxidoreductase [Verrucomicrobiae bacterium]|nr:Gfo/Idh/MocA family oxidoreductase [Verrucomicrobiae bacterium]